MTAETAQKIHNIPNPYVGPRPFAKEDRARFFGREQEAYKLIPLVISERLVLFYAQSGAGKSSLINARLIPGLEARNFQILAGRVSGQAISKVKPKNIFTYNLLLGLEQSAGRGEQVDPARLAQMSISDYLADLDIDAAAVASSAPQAAQVQPAAAGAALAGAAGSLIIDAPPIIDGIRPLALIIDQFEEIFTTNPGAWSERGPFFEQLAEAMNNDPYLWVVLSMREDYVAGLDPYAALLPGRLRARFYMQRMGKQAAREAVQRPVEQILPFDDDAAEELVNKLSQVAVGKDAAGQLVYKEGEFIEPVQLQVVCYQLWNELQSHPRENTRSITKADLLRLAQNSGKDAPEKKRKDKDRKEKARQEPKEVEDQDQALMIFISDALAGFYENALSEVLDEYPDLRERRLRAWFSEELITEGETRGAVLESKEFTGSPANQIPNAAVAALQKRFIIRAEIRGQNIWYELSHDRFVAPILQSNRAWFDRNTPPVEAAALAWKKSGFDATRLLDGTQLRTALRLLNESPEEFSELAVEYVHKSQDFTEGRNKRRQQIAVAALVTLLVLVTSLAVFAFRNLSIVQQQKSTVDAYSANLAAKNAELESARQEAVQQANLAATSEAEARIQAAAASTAEVESRKNAQAAQAAEEDARKQAEEAKKQAEIAQSALNDASVQFTRAEEQTKISQARQLSALSGYFRASRPDLSQLLGVYALDMFDDWSTRKALLDGIQAGMTSQLKRSGFTLYSQTSPATVAISPDGKLMAAGGDGTVELWNVDKQSPVGSLPEQFISTGQVNVLAFDADSRVLARAGAERLVRFYDVQNKRVLKPFYVFPPSGAYNSVVSVSYQPGGDLLAATTAIDPTTRNGLIVFYNVKTEQVYYQTDCGQTDCMYSAWSPDGSRLAVGTRSGALIVIDVAQKTKILTNPKAHQEQITGVAWYPDNNRVVTGAVDRRLVVWDVDRKEKVAESKRQDTPIVISVAISPDGSYVVAGVNDEKTPRWFSLYDGQTLERLNYETYGHSRPVSAIAVNAQGNRFITAGYDKAINIWDFKPVDSLSKVLTTQSTPRVEDIIANGSGSLMARSVAGTVVEIYADGKLVKSINQAHASLALVNLAGAPALLVGDYDGKVSLIDPLTGQPLREALKVGVGKVQAVTASEDGSRLAAAVCNTNQGCDSLVVVDLKSGKPVDELKQVVEGLITAVSLRQDGKLLAVGNGASRIVLYDIEAKTVLEVATEELTQRKVNLVVTSLAFSPQEEDLLVAGFHTGQVAMWQVSSRGPIGKFLEQTNDQVTGLSFGKDETGDWALLSVSAPGEVRRWTTDPHAWVKQACKLAGRDLTPEERASYLLAGQQNTSLCQ